MKISICTQIKNRKHQIEKVFNHNIKKIKQYNFVEDVVEWVIVDVNSSDGLKDFIEPHVNNSIKYFQCLEKINYSIPIAKNFGPRLCSGDYVFNLDADNYIDSAIHYILINKYCPLNCNEYRKGTFGRIGCSKKIFKSVGGYDESFYQAAYHENDFLKRCGLLGHTFKHIPCKNRPIQNSKEETVKNFNSKLSWKQMCDLNFKKSNENLKNKIINPNTKFTQCKFLCNFDKTVGLGTEF